LTHRLDGGYKRKEVKPMKKILAILFAAIMFLGCETQQTIVKVPANVNLPRRARVIAQSCDTVSLFQTVIDLENNEIVILVYDEVMLRSVIRTGIITEPGAQAVLPSADAPKIDMRREEPATAASPAGR